jgi:hypothetical protein
MDHAALCRLSAKKLAIEHTDETTPALPGSTVVRELDPLEKRSIEQHITGIDSERLSVGYDRELLGHSVSLVFLRAAPFRPECPTCPIWPIHDRTPLRLDESGDHK